MSDDAKSRPTGALAPSAQPDKPVFRDSAQETADRGILGGAPVDHALGDAVAARTESPEEAAIDARMGLRSSGGRTPVPEDFDGIITPAGNSGDVTGDEVSDSPFVFGEDGTTVSPDPADRR